MPFAGLNRFKPAKSGKNWQKLKTSTMICLDMDLKMKHFEENSVKALCFQPEVTLTVEVFYNSKTFSWALHKAPFGGDK